ncbi:MULTISPECIES: Hpt domain-containing protein [Pacificibacter]|uniref:Hpt domain-containing protein n=1 Tax=Pacificibacter TaxID=1042323 RepID=UPI001C0804EE|nr:MULTISPECIES: Hpt domain-containing protein [Pacificibacter]MBU2936132.1 Hpt domain-containing protein [Pacificibacter marinus]MDO6615018.1 Hpt domain-containing protein [Pacificibacter sp. 1_MG-2023]
MIDWNRITELRDEVGVEDFGEVVELFLEEVDEVIERLETTGDRTKLEQDLHFLKGSSMNLGFASFSSLCQTGEIASADGHSDAVDLAEILASYKTSRAEFTSKTDIILSS